MKKTILNIVAKTAYASAKKAGNCASVWGLHQPKEPDCVKKLKKARD